jgi:hypothetical protein
MLDLEWIVTASEEVGLGWDWGFTPLATESPSISKPLMKQPATGTIYGGWYGPL